MEKLQKALQKAREQRGTPHAASSGVPAGALAGSHVDEAIATRPRPANGSATEATETGQSLSASNPGAERLWQALGTFEPSAKAMERNRIVTAQAGRLGTAFDILRTKILLAMRKNGWNRLAITSPTMGGGKTTTACNLTIGFARNPDQRTILVELDLRRPSVAMLLDLPKGPDVTEMLSGDITFAEQALRYRQNVAVAAAHKASPDPTSVLTSKAIHNTLAEIETSYSPDLMIFDLPPLLVGDDTRSVLKDVDCALLVARSDVTTVAQIDTCEREIAEHTNMLGVVLNQCRDPDDEYGYYE
jgi:capsular exopolysaccharide synthesis family protein